LGDYYLAEKADLTPERIYTLDEVVKELDFTSSKGKQWQKNF
jgi:hypothetical protein